MAGSTKRALGILRSPGRLVPARPRRLDQGDADQGVGGPERDPRRFGRERRPRPHPQAARRSRDARCAASRRRDGRSAPSDQPRTVQAGAGDERGHCRALRHQPPARGAAGPLFDGEREFDRPRPPSQRAARRDRGAQDRFHPERRRRDRPIPLRPQPETEGSARRAAPELPERGAGPLRRQQQRSFYGDAPRRAGDGLPAVQQGRSRRQGEPAEPRRPPDQLSLARGLGARTRGSIFSADTSSPKRTRKSRFPS